MSESLIDPEPDDLLSRASTGDKEALRLLFDGHRERLKRMVVLRLDPRLSARIDPSDVVQEALIDASKKLNDYVRDRPLPFYPWLHCLTTERLAIVHRQHVKTQAMAVGREEARASFVDRTTEVLAERLTSNEPTPGTSLVREEQRQRVHSALEGLKEKDRNLLVMRYLEDMSFPEIAAILEIGESAAKMRHLRALQLLREAIGDIGFGSFP